MKMASAKTELVAMKNEPSLSCRLAPTEIVLLISKGWSKSFGRFKANYKAIIEI